MIVQPRRKSQIKSTAIALQLPKIVSAPRAEYKRFIPYPSHKVGEDRLKWAGCVDILLLDGGKIRTKRAEYRRKRRTNKLRKFTFDWTSRGTEAYRANLDSFHDVIRQAPVTVPTGCFQISDDVSHCITQVRIPSNASAATGLSELWHNQSIFAVKSATIARGSQVITVRPPGPRGQEAVMNATSNRLFLSCAIFAGATLLPAQGETAFAQTTDTSNWQTYGGASSPVTMQLPPGWSVNTDAATGRIEVSHESGAWLSVLPFSVSNMTI